MIDLYVGVYMCGCVSEQFFYEIMVLQSIVDEEFCKGIEFRMKFVDESGYVMFEVVKQVNMQYIKRLIVYRVQVDWWVVKYMLCVQVWVQMQY